MRKTCFLRMLLGGLKRMNSRELQSVDRRALETAERICARCRYSGCSGRRTVLEAKYVRALLAHGFGSYSGVSL